MKNCTLLSVCDFILTKYQWVSECAGRIQVLKQDDNEMEDEICGEKSASTSKIWMWGKWKCWTGQSLKTHTRTHTHTDLQSPTADTLKGKLNTTHRGSQSSWLYALQENVGYQLQTKSFFSAHPNHSHIKSQVTYNVMKFMMTLHDCNIKRRQSTDIHNCTYTIKCEPTSTEPKEDFPFGSPAKSVQ